MPSTPKRKKPVSAPLKARRRAPPSPPAAPAAALTLATWNVNSIRLRYGLLTEFITGHRPDVLCLQEIKIDTPAFPRDFFTALGYRHLAVAGQPGYHGVAIAARVPLAGISSERWAGKNDARHVAATLPDGTEVHNIYVPSGGDIPDPAVNGKFAHKLRFLADVAAWFAARRRAGNRLALLGDFNVAPLETDVWSHRQLLGVVSHTPVEVAALARLAASHGWVDAVRRFIPPSERLYTWWSYRSPNWKKSNRGRRLDHIWVTPALAPALQAAAVVKALRSAAQPSDHVPVLATLRL